MFKDCVSENKVATAATIAMIGGAAAAYQYGYVPENVAGIAQDGLAFVNRYASSALNAVGSGLSGGLGLLGQGTMAGAELLGQGVVQGA